MKEPLRIDGSRGEGGGQVLRTCLALSLVTGRPFRLERIRAGRSKPGLRAQHLVCVQAAQAVGLAEVEGARLGSSTLEFRPHALRAGEYRFDLGGAGSTSLVLQSVAPALLCAEGPSTLTLRGGTHNPWAPCFEFVAEVYAPWVQRCGGELHCELSAHGFFPRGGGRVRYRIQPGPLRPLEILEPGEPGPASASVLVAGDDERAGRAELRALEERLGLPTELRRVRSRGSGKALLVHLPAAEGGELLWTPGARGAHPAALAEELACARERFSRAEVPVGEHLADQLVLLLALAGGGRLRTLPPSGHTRTQLELIPRFLPLRCETRRLGAERYELALTSAGARP